MSDKPWWLRLRGLPPPPTEAEQDLWYRRYTRPQTIISEGTFVVMPLILAVIGASQGEWVAAGLCLLIGVVFIGLVAWRIRYAWSKERPR
jgi:hypothetical protein